MDLSLRSFLTVLVWETAVLIKANAKLQLIRLNINGSISDTSNLPICLEGGSMDLVSYKYIKNVCSPDGYCYRKEAILTTTAEIILHKMCSSRAICIPMSFPASDLKDIGVDTIELEYYCLDHFVTFLDLCSDTTKRVDTTVHLRTSNTFKTSKECTCSVMGGPFAVSVNDVRLSSRRGHGCSPARLLLPYFHYSCESDSENLGSVFNTAVSNSTSKFIVQLQINSEKVFPQMVWMTIQPKGSITVTCKSHLWDGEQSVTTEVTAEATETTKDSDRNTSKRKNLYAILGVVSGVAVFIFLVLSILFVYLKRKRRTRSNSLAFELNQFSNPQPAEIDRSDIGGKVGNKSEDLPRRDEEGKLLQCNEDLKVGTDSSKPKAERIYQQSNLKAGIGVTEGDNPQPAEIDRSDIGDKVGNKSEDLPRRDEEVKLLQCNEDLKVGTDSSKPKAERIYQRSKLKAGIGVTEGDNPQPAEIDRSDIGDKVGNKSEDLPRRDEEGKLLQCNEDLKVGTDSNKPKAERIYQRSNLKAGIVVTEGDNPQPAEIDRSDIGDKVGNKSEDLPRRDEEVKLLQCNEDLKVGTDSSKPKAERIYQRSNLKAGIGVTEGDNPQPAEIDRSDIGDKVGNKSEDLPRRDEEVKLLQCNEDLKVGTDSSKPKAERIYQRSNLKAGIGVTESDTNYYDLDINAIIEHTMKEIQIINTKINTGEENEMRQELRSLIQQRTKTNVTDFPI